MPRRCYLLQMRLLIAGLVFLSLFRTFYLVDMDYLLDFWHAVKFVALKSFFLKHAVFYLFTSSTVLNPRGRVISTLN